MSTYLARLPADIIGEIAQFLQVRVHGRTCDPPSPGVIALCLAAGIADTPSRECRKWLERDRGCGCEGTPAELIHAHERHLRDLRCRGLCQTSLGVTWCVGAYLEKREGGGTCDRIAYAVDRDRVDLLDISEIYALVDAADPRLCDAYQILHPNRYNENSDYYGHRGYNVLGNIIAYGRIMRGHTLKRDFEFYDLCMHNRDGYTPLMVAVSHCNPHQVSTMLSYPCDIDARANDGMTALHRACLHPDVTNYQFERVIESLLIAGANVRIRDNIGNTALGYYIAHWRMRACYAIVRRFMDAGADLADTFTGVRAPHHSRPRRTATIAMWMAVMCPHLLWDAARNRMWPNVNGFERHGGDGCLVDYAVCQNYKNMEFDRRQRAVVETILSPSCYDPFPEHCHHERWYDNTARVSITDEAIQTAANMSVVAAVSADSPSGGRGDHAAVSTYSRRRKWYSGDN